MPRLAPSLTLALLLPAAACTLTRGLGPGSRGGLRRFYLTKDTVQGNRALGACARAFHMASRFELLDPSVLDYDTSLGLTADDSGMGPPAKGDVYAAPGPIGWARTGGPSKYRDAAETPGSASTNCATWSSNSGDAYGTTAFLSDRFTTANESPAAIWSGGSQHCDRAFHVWCVQDRPAREEAPEGEHRGYRRME